MRANDHPLLTTLLAGLFLLSILSCSQGSDGELPDVPLKGPAANGAGGFDYNLTIIHSNDIHDQIRPMDGTDLGGLARHKTLIDLFKAEAASRGVGILALNAGDTFDGGLFHDVSGGSFALELLNAAGYDAHQVGNHDCQYGAAFLHAAMKSAFPLLDQNMKFLWGNVTVQRMSAIGTPNNPPPGSFAPVQVDQEVIDGFEDAFLDWSTGTLDFSLMDAPLANSKVFNQTLFYDMNGIRVGIFGLVTDEALYTTVPGQGELYSDPTGLSEGMRFYSGVTHTYASDMIT